MKTNACKQRKETIFEVNDWVFHQLHPYRQTSLSLDKHTKLSPKLFGPCRIVARIGQVAFKLELPSDANIHGIFHVSMLKRKSEIKVCGGTGITRSFCSQWHFTSSTDKSIMVIRRKWTNCK